MSEFDTRNESIILGAAQASHEWGPRDGEINEVGRRRERERNHYSWLWRQIDVSDSGEFVGTCDDAGEVVVYDANTRVRLKRLRKHSNV